MKTVKRAVYVLLVLFVLPIIAYMGIVIANNAIADEIEKNLVAYSLPSDTEIIDSASVAGKITGNGNGMQYMGVILVESDLSEDELKEYYGANFDYIEVRKQEDSNIDFIYPKNYSFNDFEDKNGVYYSVVCFDDCKEKYGEFISSLLDFDIRGH